MQLKGGQRESRISLSVRWMDGRLAGCRCCCCFWVGVALSRITHTRGWLVNAITEICDCLSYLLLLCSTMYYHYHRSVHQLTHTHWAVPLSSRLPTTLWKIIMDDDGGESSGAFSQTLLLITTCVHSTGDWAGSIERWIEGK